MVLFFDPIRFQEQIDIVGEEIRIAYKLHRSASYLSRLLPDELLKQCNYIIAETESLLAYYERKEKALEEILYRFNRMSLNNKRAINMLSEYLYKISDE